MILYPVLWVIGGSFKESGDIVGSLDLFPGDPITSNYTSLADGIADISISTFFLNSLFLAVGSVIGIVVSCSLTAYAFAKIRFAGRNLLFTLMIGTLLLPYHVLLIPQYVLFRNLDMINTYTPLLLGKYLATEAFFVFLMVQFMRNLPRELDEAARLDGCGHFRHLLVDRAPAVPAGADHQRDLHLHQLLERLHGPADLPQRARQVHDLPRPQDVRGPGGPGELRRDDRHVARRPAAGPRLLPWPSSAI
ncbi:hypothetical protein STENM327S_08081 [Streptomyces tendae]